jgi:hypothetical protein
LLPALELSTLGFSSTHKHIASYTENNWAPHPLRLARSTHNRSISWLGTGT